MTPEKLDEDKLSSLYALAKKATPGPWEYHDMTQSIMGHSIGGCRLEMSMHKVADIRGWGHYQYLPNGAEIQDGTGKYIAAASPDVVTALIDRVRELEANLGAASNYVDQLGGDSAGFRTVLARASGESNE